MNPSKTRFVSIRVFLTVFALLAASLPAWGEMQLVTAGCKQILTVVIG